MNRSLARRFAIHRHLPSRRVSSHRQVALSLFSRHIQAMPEVSLSDWNRFIHSHPDPHLLQTGEWGALKSAFGWEAVRLIAGEMGAQILFRKLPLGFTIGYIPKMAISDRQLAV